MSSLLELTCTNSSTKVVFFILHPSSSTNVLVKFSSIFALLNRDSALLITSIVPSYSIKTDGARVIA